MSLIELSLRRLVSLYQIISQQLSCAREATNPVYTENLFFTILCSEKSGYKINQFGLISYVSKNKSDTLSLNEHHQKLWLKNEEWNYLKWVAPDVPIVKDYIKFVLVSSGRTNEN